MGKVCSADGMRLVSAIDNVHIYVRDMRRALAFYRDVLGMSFTGDEHWSEADLAGVRFALHEWSESVSQTGSGGISVNFRVGDADAAAAQVRAAGYDVREQMREEYGISYEVVDPDGYRIYLFQKP
jgi:predicted enzyme related to lactoylglutathione lyase